MSQLIVSINHSTELNRSQFIHVADYPEGTERYSGIVQILEEALIVARSAANLHAEKAKSDIQEENQNVDGTGCKANIINHGELTINL